MERQDMDQQTLWREFNGLPSGAKRLVVEMIALLGPRNRSRTMVRKAKAPVSETPFVGMWRDRDDLAESSAWVRKVRAHEWGSGRG